MLHRLVDLLARWPWLSLLLVMLITAVAALSCFDDAGRLRIRIDASTDQMLPADDPDRLSLERLRENFGDPDVILLAVGLNPVWTPDHLRAISRLHQALARFDGVDRVFSLTNAPNLIADDDALEVRSFTEQAESNPASVGSMAAAIAANPLYRNTLVSADGRYVAFIISLDPIDEARFLADDVEARLRALAVRETASTDVRVTGVAIIRAATTRALLDTLAFTIPTIYALIVLLSLFAFRSLRASFTVLAGVSIALVWTLATAAVLEIPLNLVTVIAPPLVITLGLAYSVHLLSEYFSEPARNPDERRLRLAQVLRNLTPALLLSTATTIAGLMALLFNALPAVRQFVWLSVAGVAYLLLLTVLFMPALLTVLRCGRGEHRQLGQRLAARLAAPLARFDTRWRSLIIRSALIMVPGGLLLAAGLPVGTDYVKGFVADHPARQDYETISDSFSGANLVVIDVQAHLADALLEPALLRAVDELQTWLRGQPEVGAVASYVDHLRLINRSFHAQTPGDDGLPETAAAAKQLLLFSGGDSLRRVIDARYSEGLISIRLKVNDSIEIAAFAERVRSRLAALPAPLDARLTGSSIVATRTVQAIGQGQWWSLAVAAVVIWALLTLMFTSVTAGLWALLPNLLPVAVYFGLLRTLGIPLNPTNSLIATIVLGIAVDDTVHFLTRFNRHARALGSETAAVERALAGTLRPTSLNTLALCLGLLMFAGSELRSQVQFGLLASFTLLIAWISEITLTPALATRLRIVSLWDLVRLDLGHSPQHTIPLLSGLSLRQARIFALSATIERHPGGHRIIRQGDRARDMYLIIDGEVEVWIERNGEHQVLAQLGRGTVLGEAGYFGQTRTANAQSIGAVRVLRFDSQDLERLRRRYPRIAATVFRNLNRVQAERLARATAMLQDDGLRS